MLEVVEISFFPLPITEEGRALKETPAAEVKAPTRGASGNLSVPSGVARTSRPESPSPFPSPLPLLSPQDLLESQQQAESPPASIDWQAELGTAAGAMDERARAERERRSFSHPPPHASLTPKHVKPSCPFERCEPGWGAGPSVFDSTATKKGRVEQTVDGEVIRWTSNNCYQILI